MNLRFCYSVCKKVPKKIFLARFLKSHFWTLFGTLGPLGPFGSKFGGPEIGSHIWIPSLGPKLGSQIWVPKLLPNLDPQNVCPKFGSPNWVPNSASIFEPACPLLDPLGFLGPLSLFGALWAILALRALVGPLQPLLDPWGPLGPLGDPWYHFRDYN